MLNLKCYLAIQNAAFFDHTVDKNIAQGIADHLLQLVNFTSGVPVFDRAAHKVQDHEGGLPSHPSNYREITIASLDLNFFLFSEIQ